MNRSLPRAVALLLLAGFVGPRAANAERPNIVFIMADDLGYGDVGCYGQTRIQTPNIDRLAEEGIRFTDFHAGSTVCAPSRCVLLTGLHTGHCFIRGNGKTDLRPGDVTFAELAKAAGYATGMFGKWGLGHEGSTGLPTRQGFDAFFGYLDQHHAHNYYPSFLIDGEGRVPLRNVVPNEGQFGQGVADEKVEYSHDVIAARMFEFLERHRDEPFLLYLPFTIPHANNEGGKNGMEVPELGDYAERDWPQNQQRHAAMISRLDRDLGRLLDRLDAWGIADNTIVFFTSDNGPHREGGNDPDYFDSNGPLRGIKRDLYEGGIRVPMLVRWPGHAAAGTASDFVGDFADILPTIADLVGVDPPKGVDGVSILPTIAGRPAEQRRRDYLYWEFYEGGSAQAVRIGNWKGIAKPFGGPIELYDLGRDLGEEHDVALRHPDVVANIRSAMTAAHVPSPLWTLPASKNPKRRK